MNGKSTFREGERVTYHAPGDRHDSEVAVVRTRISPNGREWVDVRFLSGMRGGYVTTVAAENLTKHEARRMRPVAGGEIA